MPTLPENSCIKISLQPAATTIWRILQQARALGRFLQIGKGCYFDPYRYQLADASALGNKWNRG